MLDALQALETRVGESLDAPGFAASDDGESLADRIGIEERGFDAAEAAAIVGELLSGLPERQRLVILLRFSEDLTQAEIGRRIGCSQMHVSRLLRTALARIAARSASADCGDGRPALTLS